MLERFEKITKIGLFEDHTHESGCDFGDVTLVYGENGVGKSTLAAILDSLRERTANEIIRRRSLPCNVAPAVIVQMGGKAYTFTGTDWDAQLPYDTLDVFFPALSHATCMQQQGLTRNTAETFANSSSDARRLRRWHCSPRLIAKAEPH